MNTAMLRIKGEAKVYMVPEGLPQLLSDISREVLRSSPRNIYQFVAEYLMTVLRVRESVKGAIPTVDAAIEEAAERISFLNRLNVTEDVANKAATVIQAAWRGYVVRKKLRNIAIKLTPVDGLLESEVDKEREEAAIKIQAFFRGFYTRMKLSVEGPDYFLKRTESRDSWSHEWARKESEVRLHREDTECDQQVEHLDDDLRYALIRSVEGPRLRLATVFRGSYENYELLAESCTGHDADKELLQNAIQARSIHSDSERYVPDPSLMKKISKGSKDTGASVKSSKSKLSSVEEASAESVKKSVSLHTAETPGEFDVDISEFQWGAESAGMSEESWIGMEEESSEDTQRDLDEEDPVSTGEALTSTRASKDSKRSVGRTSKGSKTSSKGSRRSAKNEDQIVGDAAEPTSAATEE